MHAMQLYDDPTSVGAADALSKPGSQGVWLKTHIRRHGHYVTATMYCVGPNKDGVADIEVIKATVDVRPIMRRLVRLHKQMHAADKVSGDVVGGFSFKKIRRVAKKAWGAGKSKAVRKVWNTSKKVMKSKITHGVVAATAVAFPAVGVPAAAALASANTAIDALEKGNRVLSQANQVASNLRKGSNIKAELLRIARTHGKGYLKAYLARNPSLKIHASMALRYEGHVRRVLGNPVRKAKLKRTMRRYKAAKTFVAKVNYAAARGKGKERTDARKMQAILRLAAQNRSRIKRMTEELEGGTPGILIDSRGRFKAGRYVLEPSAEGTPDVLMLKTSERKGRYRRVRIDPAKARRLAAYKKRQRSLELQAKRLRAQRAAVAKKKVRARKKTALRRIRRRLSMMNPVRRARAIRTLSARLRKARQRIMLRRARRARKPMTRQQKIYSRLPSTALSAMRR